MNKIKRDLINFPYKINKLVEEGVNIFFPEVTTNEIGCFSVNQREYQKQTMRIDNMLNDVINTQNAMRTICQNIVIFSRE